MYLNFCRILRFSDNTGVYSNPDFRSADTERSDFCKTANIYALVDGFVWLVVVDQGF